MITVHAFCSGKVIVSAHAGPRFFEYPNCGILTALSQPYAFFPWMVRVVGIFALAVVNLGLYHWAAVIVICCVPFVTVMFDADEELPVSLPPSPLYSCTPHTIAPTTSNVAMAMIMFVFVITEYYKLKNGEIIPKATRLLLKL